MITQNDHFHSYPTPLALVSREGEVIAANRRFSDFVHGADELMLSNGRLFFSNQATHQRFSTLLGGVGKQRKHDSEIGIVIGLDNGNIHTLSVFPMPPELYLRGSPMADALVVAVEKKGGNGVPGVKSIGLLLRLTEAEAKVAALIGQGLGPSSIATQLGLSVHSVRSTLKKVYSKTNTSRQNELTALLHKFGLG